MSTFSCDWSSWLDLGSWIRARKLDIFYSQAGWGTLKLTLLPQWLWLCGFSEASRPVIALASEIRSSSRTHSYIHAAHGGLLIFTDLVLVLVSLSWLFKGNSCDSYTHNTFPVFTKKIVAEFTQILYWCTNRVRRCVSWFIWLSKFATKCSL